MKERLQKIIAQAGITSRRKAELLIVNGDVLVNGKVATLGESADAQKDEIIVQGRRISKEAKVYIMLNKPRGVVTTVSEQHGMRTVLDLVKVSQRVFPVGRLDKDTRGLLLLTNDGELMQRVTHPRFEIVKKYLVVLDKPLSDDQFFKLSKGVVVDNRKVAIRGCEVQGKVVVLRIHEGRKHIVRRLFEEIGAKVADLVRIAVGELELGNLQSGKWRFLASGEVQKLRGVKARGSKKREDGFGNVVDKIFLKV